MKATAKPKTTPNPKPVSLESRFKDSRESHYLKFAAFVCEGARAIHSAEVSFARALHELTPAFLASVNETREREHLEDAFEGLLHTLNGITDSRWYLLEMIEKQTDPIGQMAKDSEIVSLIYGKTELGKVSALLNSGAWETENLNAAENVSRPPKAETQKGGAK